MFDDQDDKFSGTTTMVVDGYTFRLDRTCYACPEQYDVFLDDKQVAYFRLRWGTFSVDYPDASGKMIYCVCPEGDGIFDSEERERHLTLALKAVLNYMQAIGDLETKNMSALAETKSNRIEKVDAIIRLAEDRSMLSSNFQLNAIADELRSLRAMLEAEEDDAIGEVFDRDRWVD